MNNDDRIINHDFFLFLGATTTFGRGAGPVYFSDFDCSGSENYLIHCTYYTNSQCPYSYTSGIKCEGNSNIQLWSTFKSYTIQFPVHIEMFV